MNDSAGATDMRAWESRLMRNCRPSRSGGLEARAGTQRLSSAALTGAGRFIGEFTTTGGTRQLVACTDGKLRYSSDDGATWTVAMSGLPDTYPDSAVMQVGGTSYMILAFGGAQKLVSFDGATAAAIAAGPTGATTIATMGGRLWAAGHAGSTAWASKIENFNVWAAPDGLTQPVADDESGNLTIRALRNWRGTLLVFKQRSISTLEGYGESDLVVQAGARALAAHVANVFPRTISYVGDGGLCWCSERGIEYFDGQTIRMISSGIDGWYSQVNLAALDTEPRLAHAVYEPDRNEYKAWLPHLDADDPSNGLHTAVFNFTTSGCYIEDYTQGGDAVNATPFCTTIASILYGGARRGRPVAVTYGGWPIVMNVGSYEFADNAGANGAEIAAEFWSRRFDLKEPSRQKWLRWVVLRGRAEDGTDETVTVGANGDEYQSVTTQQVVFPAGGAGTLRRVGLTLRAAEYSVTLTFGRNFLLDNLEVLAAVMERGRIW